MADKDLTEKTLEAYNDVFADIMNVLLFDGKREVSGWQWLLSAHKGAGDRLLERVGGGGVTIRLICCKEMKN